ncbi:glycosyltransferase [Vibrio ezurae]|uniref:Putative glycosyltransferase n=1 Tax=Vibrio ezurae NBRC 102218 TaxID=1219080 RepID=U3AI79_9VIBR|nr:glycosyltransferase [Vibrio ezurae]GAD79636.1 putative glycosyltransferase [Vibrio ezurae NBRC 102218]
MLHDIDIQVSTTNTNMRSKLNVETNKWLYLKNFRVKYYNETIIDKFSLSLAFNVWRDIKQADLVHIQSIFNTPTPISLIYAKILKKKVILSPRGSLGEWCLENGNRFKSYWLKYAIAPFLNDVIWHSTAQQEKNEILKIFPTARVEIIPNGIEYGKFQNYNPLTSKQYIEKFLNLDADAEKIVVSMGRIQKKKGFDILINSFVDVLNEYPESKLLIAGENEGELTKLLSLVNNLKLTEFVFFIGPISGQDKIDFLSNADLFVLPSHNENFGNVYVESLAVGTPIVASTNTPWCEVEDADCGKWVPNSIKETSHAMMKMLSKDRETMRRNAKTLAEKYDWKNVAVQFKKVYENMVGL